MASVDLGLKGPVSWLMRLKSTQININANAERAKLFDFPGKYAGNHPHGQKIKSVSIEPKFGVRRLLY